MYRALSLLACLLMLSTSATGRGHSASADTAKQRLDDLFAAEWDWTMEQNPTWASALGDRRWNTRWEDVSLQAIQARDHHQRETLQRLSAIPRTELEPPDQISYDIFKYLYETDLEGYQYENYLIRTNTYDGIQTVQRLAESLRFETVQDYEDWIARLGAFPDYLDQNIALMRRGIARNVLLPKVIMRRIAAQAERLASEPTDESGFYKPFRRIPAAIAEKERERLAAAGRRAVATAVQPSYRRLATFISNEYLPAAYDRVGIWQAARGVETYAYLARYYTTTALTPRQIHEMGLKEVERIRGDMERIAADVGFKGSLLEFFNHLRTDPRFFYPNGDAYLEATRAIAKRIDPQLVKVLRTLPRLPYGVEPVPAALAPDQPAGYAEYGAPDGSRPAYYYVNLYKPESRPKWEMMALALHEAVPGHCLQGSLAQEVRDLPNFRKHAGFTAYVEGWALYAESLGHEMGLYDDPYSRFGQLTYEMWRAVRLVVDTGMHAFQWDRDRAIRYFMENAAKTELDVTNEVDRYISWPGQALAYKVGELKIQELRRRASATLANRFDLREFHDLILLSGAMPLDILEARVDAWIAAERQSGDANP
jgi:uncharacterized protein (DUF885 family)